MAWLDHLSGLEHKKTQAHRHNQKLTHTHLTPWVSINSGQSLKAQKNPLKPQRRMKKIPWPAKMSKLNVLKKAETQRQLTANTRKRQSSFLAVL